MGVTVDEVRELASTLPRSYEVFVRGLIKFRVGSIVWLSLSEDGTTMGCAFPKELRAGTVEAEPEKFSFPGESDLRFNWIHISLGAGLSLTQTAQRPLGAGRDAEQVEGVTPGGTRPHGTQLALSAARRGRFCRRH